MKPFGLTVLLLFISGTTFGAGSNWMSRIDNDSLLTELSIPGTHDSGAMHEPIGGTAKCQNLTIAQQLSAGVRFLDIRCRHFNDTFEIHHGQVYQEINFDHVLNACNSFLSANPSETIVMSVKEEYNADGNSLSFSQVFDNYVAKNPDMWHLGTSMPRLGDVRGKIVLFRRFPSSSVGGLNASSWSDNTTFSINGATPMRVQDFYNCGDAENKYGPVNSMWSEARNGSTDTLYLNYTSGYKSGLFGIPSITTVSDYMNPRIQSYFASNTSGRFGVVIMDFANAARCELIYNTNPFDQMTVDLATTYYNYDLGPAESPLMAGWSRISDLTHGEVSWSSPVGTRDRGVVSGVNNINRDLIQSPTPSTLEHKLANGYWNVVLNMGDASYAHDNMVVKAEGVTITNGVSNAAEEFPYVIFETVVLDGSLSIEFSDGGGSDANWVVTRMSLEKTGEVVDLAKTAFNYDLGPADSVVFPNWSLIHPGTAGDIYWNTTVEARDRGPISGINDANRDLIQNSSAAILQHRVANGTWSVTLNMGDATNPHDDMRVTLEDTVSSAVIDSAVQEFPYAHATAFVDDGFLTLKFEDLGGADVNWVATRLSLQNRGNDHRPIAYASSGSVTGGGSIGITLNGSDADGDALTYIVLTRPANGALSGSGSNLTYTADLTYAGSDSFTYKVKDTFIDSEVTTATITVTANTDYDNDGLPNDWESQYFGSATAATPHGNPDGDSAPNLIEYAFGGNPTNANLVGTEPQVTKGATNMECVFALRDDPDLRATILVCPDLIVGNWSTNGLQLGTNGSGYSFYTNSLPYVNALFIKLMIEK